MKKVLPINLDNVMGRCWDIYRLAALMTNDRYLPWYCEKFIDLYMPYWYDIYNYKHYSTLHISMYDEVLEYKNINYKSEDIISEITKGIDQGGYVLSIMRVEHYGLHDVLILGYDDKKQELYLFNVSDFRHDWNTYTVKYDDYINCFFSGVEALGELYSSNPQTFREVGDSEIVMEYYMHNLPLSIFFLKPIDRKPNLAKIYCSLDNYLKGTEVPIINDMEGDYFKKERFGIAIYKAYHNELDEIIENVNPHILDEWSNIPREVKKIEYNKKGLAYRLNYLRSLKMIPDCRKIESDLNVLCEKINKAFMRLNKFSFSYDLSVWRKVRKEFIDIENLDIEIITQCKNMIYNSITSSYTGR